MSTAIYSTEPTEPTPPERPRRVDIHPDTLTVDELCRLLRLAPTAVPVLAERRDVDVRLPGHVGYCPDLDDVRIVGMRRGLTGDTTLLAALRAEHPPEKCHVHLWRMTALGGVLRVLGR